MTKTIRYSSKLIFRESLEKHENRTINSKIIFYPICYHINNNTREVMTKFLENPACRNEKYCIVEPDKCSFRIKLSSAYNSFYHNET